MSTPAGDIRLLVLDVDGVLTDGGIYYGNGGEELKRFSIKDGLGVKLLQHSGIGVAIITGRSSNLVERSAAELGIQEVIQGREDKREALVELCGRLALTPAQCAYMGDDLPDLGAIRAAGIGMSVADGSETVRAAADWVAERKGGDGAVREAAEYLLRASGRLEQALAGFD